MLQLPKLMLKLVRFNNPFKATNLYNELTLFAINLIFKVVRFNNPANPSNDYTTFPLSIE